MYRQRSPAMVIILSLVTCGLYPLYWYYRTSGDIQSALGTYDTEPGVEVVLIVVTCGIYVIYWWYKYGTRVMELQRLRGAPVRDNVLLYTLLSAVGAWLGWMDLVNMAIMQSDLNDLWDVGHDSYA